MAKSYNMFNVKHNFTDFLQQAKEGDFLWQIYLIRNFEAKNPPPHIL